MSPAVEEKPSKLYKEFLAKRIMDTKAKAERAECERDYTHFMERYLFLKKRWAAVCGNAVIGIEIPVDKPK